MVSSSSSTLSSSSGISSTSSVSSSSSNPTYYTDKGNSISNYKTVKIGDQTWMAENLNYDVPGSKCYGEGGIIKMDEDYNVTIITLSDGEIQFNCNTYGRLYDWATAMALPSDCNSSSCASQVSAKHRGICPSGWHIPSNEEWDALYRYADGTNGTSSPYHSVTAGKFLKAKNGWNNCGTSGSGKTYSCEDAKGFSALTGVAGLMGAERS
jgi:uncharacterized protein (TIGR02145 family)